MPESLFLTKLQVEASTFIKRPPPLLRGKVHKNSVEKMFAKYLCRWLFPENNTSNCAENNDAMFLDTRALTFTRQSMKRNLT